MMQCPSGRLLRAPPASESVLDTAIVAMLSPTPYTTLHGPHIYAPIRIHIGTSISITCLRIQWVKLSIPYRP